MKVREEIFELIALQPAVLVGVEFVLRWKERAKGEWRCAREKGARAIRQDAWRRRQRTNHASTSAWMRAVRSASRLCRAFIFFAVGWALASPDSVAFFPMMRGRDEVGCGRGAAGSRRRASQLAERMTGANPQLAECCGLFRMLTLENDTY